MAVMPQVVELPREGPEQALKLFGGLPNLRLLVIGGDGTVAWILSCIDSIQVTIHAASISFAFRVSIATVTADTSRHCALCCQSGLRHILQPSMHSEACSFMLISQ